MAQFVYTLTPNQILEARASVLRNKFESAPLGGIDPKLTSIGVDPYFGISVRIAGSFTAQPGNPFIDNQTIPQFAALHTWNRGRMTLRSRCKAVEP